MTNSIVWSRKGRPRKADQGHTVVRWGEKQGHRFGDVRYYAECQCGHVNSSLDSMGVIYGHDRHAKKALAEN